MNLTLAEAAIGAGAVLEAPARCRRMPARSWRSGYSIDSRTVAPGELFFAVRGERFDGHDFVAAAHRARRRRRRGLSRARRLAAGCGARRAAPDRRGSPARAAGAGHACAPPWGRRVVAVTGSAGKTTTKEAIAAALGAKIQRAQIAAAI